jgi:hypothetical protein
VTLDAVASGAFVRIHFEEASSDAVRVAPPRPGIPLPLAVAVGMRDYLLPPVAAAWGLHNSFERDVNGVQPLPLPQLRSLLESTAGTPGFLRLLQLGAVTHVVSLDRAHTNALEPIAQAATPLGNPIYVFRVPGSLPRVYLAGRARVDAGPPAWRTLLDPDFDPRSEVLLERADRRLAARGAGRVGRAQVVSERPDRIQIEVQTTRPGYLVVVDTYYPGWVAEVDGEPSELLRANLAFRAVALPEAGAHTVTLAYRPESVRTGLWASGAGAVVALAVALAGTGRRRLSTPQRDAGPSS